MKSALVDIHLTPRENGQVVATVNATFEMHTKIYDDTMTYKKVWMGFPVTKKSHPVVVENFAVCVDDAAQLVKPTEDDEGLVLGYSWHSKLKDSKPSFFKGSKPSIVVVTYTMILPDDPSGKKLLFYSLTSGAKWAGPIGLEIVTVTADKQLSLFPELTNNPPQKKKSGELVWTVKKSDPTEDILLYVSNPSVTK